MAKKKCCKCCNCCPDISFQIKFLLVFSIIFPFITIGLMILIMYNTYSFIYKEISKLYDLDEFQELDNIENYLENAEINIENIFKNNLQSIVHLYQEFSNFQPNYFLSGIPLDSMYYYFNSPISQNEENYLSYLGIYLKNIFEIIFLKIMFIY